MQRIYKTMDAWRMYFEKPEGESALSYLYAGEEVKQMLRYLAIGARFAHTFGDMPFAFLSAPGRTELIGNHTDHQGGRVLASAISLDMVCAAAKNNLNRLRMLSEGYADMIDISLDTLLVQEREKNTSAALLRGVAAGLKHAGYAIGGIDFYVSSDVARGSGLSSSAAIEVLIGTAFGALYNAGKIPPVKIAQVGQFAENEYFFKPCGLMDQMACAIGGVIAIDFFDKHTPRIERLPFSLSGYTLNIVNAGGSHANLTEEYAAMPTEMFAVAHALGHTRLCEVDPEAFHSSTRALRTRVSDRAILRAIHFFEENERVRLQAEALKSGDIARYREIMLSSGISSFTQLQNIYPAQDIHERSVALALSLSGQILKHRGAWRVHGGGMAGTIQALVPDDLQALYRSRMEDVFGQGSVYALHIRPVGGYALDAAE